jgi:hypothetical protein
MSVLLQTPVVSLTTAGGAVMRRFQISTWDGPDRRRALAAGREQSTAYRLQQIFMRAAPYLPVQFGRAALLAREQTGHVSGVVPRLRPRPGLNVAR